MMIDDIRNRPNQISIINNIIYSDLKVLSVNEMRCMIIADNSIHIKCDKSSNSILDILDNILLSSIIILGNDHYKIYPIKRTDITIICGNFYCVTNTYNTMKNLLEGTYNEIVRDINERIFRKY